MDNYFTPDSILKKFLCSAIAVNSSVDLEAVYYELGDEVVWDAAKTNLIAPIVAYKLINVLGEKRTPNRWIDCYKDTEKIISGYMGELDRISEILASKKIPLVALKNGGIARAVYPVPGCCPMGDLDVLVEKKHYDEASRLLIKNGYIFKNRNSMEMAFYKDLPDGNSLWLELLCRTVDGRWIRPDQEPETEEFMSRSIATPGTSVRLLSPEDNLLQVSLHTAKHTYVRAPGFRLHTDVDRIIHKYKIDWNAFLCMVNKLNVKTSVYFSLLLPKVLLETPIPKEVLDQLRPKRWKEKVISAWLKKVGLFSPDEPKFNKIGFIIFHSLLYDDITGFLRGILPKTKWMKARYNFKNNCFLPIYYGKRLFDLAFNRVKT